MCCKQYLLFSTVVGLSHKQRCMGVSAKSQLVMNCKNTVWGFKNLVGRKFSDPVVQEELKEFPFVVVQQPNDVVGIKVCCGGLQTLSYSNLPSNFHFQLRWKNKSNRRPTYVSVCLSSFLPTFSPSPFTVSLSLSFSLPSSSHTHTHTHTQSTTHTPLPPSPR